MCALLGTKILGKPGSHENALRQLTRGSGQNRGFSYRRVRVLNLSAGFSAVEDVPFEVDFRVI